MATFEVTDPSGKKFQINAPEGATQEQALAYAKTQFEKQAPANVPPVSAAPKVSDNPAIAALGGLGAGTGQVILGGQKYLGKGLRALGAETAGNWLVNDAEQGVKNIAGELQPYKDVSPLSAGGGEIAGNIAATLPVGGWLGKSVQSLGKLPFLSGIAPGLEALGTSIGSAGMRTGINNAGARALSAPVIANTATRAAGGGINGAVTAGLIDEDLANTGGIIGSVLPGGLQLAGKIGSRVGNTGAAIAKPFTIKGQNDIAGQIVDKFAEGGPRSLNAGVLVAGSQPTLSGSTGNSGLATLERSLRDVRPNAFVEREQINNLARSDLFENIAKDATTLEAQKMARDEAAGVLYGKAFASDAMRRDLAREATNARAPFGAAGLKTAADDLATPGLRELAQRPGFKTAINQAKTLAANKGVALDDPLQSLEGLHYVKLALDDLKTPGAASSLGRNEAAAFESMSSKLADELSNISPLYGNARKAYAELSQPISALESLQGLKLTDAQGNITLSKVQNAIRSIDDRVKKPGLAKEKSITKDQREALVSIRDDLMRQSKSGLGKSIGSNTFQNIATDNIISQIGGRGLSNMAGNSGVSGILGQAGKLIYSGPNEAIRNRLVDMTLNPELARPALQAIPRRPIAARGLLDVPEELLLRGAPMLGGERG